MKRNGIIAAGNFIIDKVKIIDSYPKEESLANIFSEYISNGGSAYNIAMDLVKLKVNFPIEVIGLVGNDENGNWIKEDCKSKGILTSLLQTINSSVTSYTDVMTVASTGKRTFFHQRGANSLLDKKDFLLEQSQAKILHLGYLLLLDKLDEMEEDGRSGASKVLETAKSQGFITSSDLVSENSDRFKDIIPSALPYVDYLFVNELEAGKLTGIDTYLPSGKPSLKDCILAGKKILEMGVQQWVIVHFPEGCIALNRNGELEVLGSLKVPGEKIKGAVGAGDAFAAGVLLGVHENWKMKDSLKLGICAAATCLFDPTCSEGIRPVEECLKLGNEYTFRDLKE